MPYFNPITHVEQRGTGFFFILVIIVALTSTAKAATIEYRHDFSLNESINIDRFTATRMAFGIPTQFFPLFDPTLGTLLGANVSASWLVGMETEVTFNGINAPASMILEDRVVVDFLISSGSIKRVVMLRMQNGTSKSPFCPRLS
ncbi:MAG: hypothetical protein M3H12_10235, partial [Chromatiales bacterium]